MGIRILAIPYDGNDLAHARSHKYIKKYVKNGKTYYIYNDGSSNRTNNYNKESTYSYYDGNTGDKYVNKYRTDRSQLLTSKRTSTSVNPGIKETLVGGKKTSGKTNYNVTTYGRLHSDVNNAKRVVNEVSNNVKDTAKKVKKSYDTNITGETYLKRAAKQNASANRWKTTARNESINLPEGDREYHQANAKKARKNAAKYEKLTNKSLNDYKTKSLKGKAETTAENVKTTVNSKTNAAKKSARATSVRTGNKVSSAASKGSKKVTSTLNKLKKKTSGAKTYGSNERAGKSYSLKDSGVTVTYTEKKTKKKTK